MRESKGEGGNRSIVQLCDAEGDLLGEQLGPVDVPPCGKVLLGQNVDQIRIGAYVDIVNEDSGEGRTVRIVSDLEADIERGKISISSPLAKALLGKKEGDVVEFNAPKGLTEYAISTIKY